MVCIFSVSELLGKTNVKSYFDFIPTPTVIMNLINDFLSLSKHSIQILYENSSLGSKGQVLSLTHFMPLVVFYTP